MVIVNSGQMNWHLAVLPKTTKKALEYMSKQQWLKDSSWYLAGGTALALQIGHRQSLDLDFFNLEKDFDLNLLLDKFSGAPWISDIVREATVYGTIFDAKVSFIAYPFFKPKEALRFYGYVPVLDKKDIAVMKIVAISQRGRKRDFVDLYWYAKHCENIELILERLQTQYPTVAHVFHHILKSLTYFDDAENDPMPKLFFKARWEEIKDFFRIEVPRLARKLLRLG